MKTKVNLTLLQNINLKSKIFSVGSCFAKDFASMMKVKGIYVLVNPFGTIYNIYSIYKLFDIVINKREYTKKDIYQYKEKFFSFEHSTLFDSNKLDKILLKLNTNIVNTYNYLKNTDVFILTLGTSLVYKHKEYDKIVANCHKLPNNFFNKVMLSVDENFEYLEKTVEIIRKFKKNSKIIITVSPIRHNIKDLQTNSLSKSILRISVEKIINRYENIFYFPSYEIVMDELRDYKFYKKDGIHLKRSSFKCIFRRFVNNYFSIELQNFLTQYEKYKLFKKHKIKDKSNVNYFSIAMKNLDLLYNLFLQRNSILLLKEVCNLIANIIVLFHNNKNVDDIKKKIKMILQEYPEIFNFFLSAIDILNESQINRDFEEEFSFLIDKYSFLKKFYKAILPVYYYNTENYNKIGEFYKNSL